VVSFGCRRSTARLSFFWMAHALRLQESRCVDHDTASAHYPLNCSSREPCFAMPAQALVTTLLEDPPGLADLPVRA